MIDIRNYFEREKGKKQALELSLSEKETELLSLKKDIRNTEETLGIVQIVAQQTQNKIKYHISELVTLALSSIYDDPYEFSVKFEIERNSTVAKLIFLKNGEEMDPMQESGGGPVDVAALALKIAGWLIQKPKSTNTFVFDEPGRFISRDLTSKFGEMIKKISKELGIQFIIITHLTDLEKAADKVFKVTQTKGISKVEVVK